MRSLSTNFMQNVITKYRLKIKNEMYTHTHAHTWLSCAECSSFSFIQSRKPTLSGLWRLMSSCQKTTLSNFSSFLFCNFVSSENLGMANASVNLQVRNNTNQTPMYTKTGHTQFLFYFVICWKIGQSTSINHIHCILFQWDNVFLKHIRTSVNSVIRVLFLVCYDNVKNNFVYDVET